MMANADKPIPRRARRIDPNKVRPRINVCVWRGDRDYLRSLGNGNVSRGLARVVAVARSMPVERLHSLIERTAPY